MEKYTIYTRCNKMIEENYKLKYLSNITELRDVFRKAHDYVKGQFQLYEDKKSHSFDHIVRVTNTCLNLAQKLEANLDVLLLAAIFHDVGRPIEEIDGRCHAEVSAEESENFLNKQNLSMLKKDVSEAILSHRFSKNIAPKTKEAKILQDADALDALGAIGLYRTISFSCERGLDMQEALVHFDEKLFKLPARMHFPLTKLIAENKCNILKDFVKKVEEESDNKFIEEFYQ
jgi:uncharacterized protein